MVEDELTDVSQARYTGPWTSLESLAFILEGVGCQGG